MTKRRTAQPGHDVLVLVERLVDPRRDDLDLRVRVVHGLEALGARDEVEEDDALLRDAMVEEDFDGLDCRTTGGCRMASQLHRLKEANQA